MTPNELMQNCASAEASGVPVDWRQVASTIFTIANGAMFNAQQEQAKDTDRFVFLATAEVELLQRGPGEYQVVSTGEGRIDETARDPRSAIDAAIAWAANPTPKPGDTES